MSHPIDQFFKEKLAEQSVPPPASAWAAVESRVAKKKRSFPWAWRIAAALLVFVLPLGLWLSLRTGPSGEAMQVSRTDGTPQGAIDSVALPRNSPPATIAASEQQPSETNQVKQSPSLKARPQDKAFNAQTAQVVDTVHKTVAPITDAVAETQTAVAVVQPKPIVIEFSLDPVAPPVVTAEATEKKGLQRFLEKAREVKNGESDLGLREATHDLLAWGFRKDKPKRN